MGIIKAAKSSLSAGMQDQWADYFYCDAIPSDQLMVRGCRRGNGEGSGGSSEVITTGSIVCVADGEAAIFVASDGSLACFTEPGEHKIENGGATLFQKGGVKSVVQDAVHRFSFGGGDVPASTQRLYYVNTREIPGAEFAFERPVPFHIVDENTGLDLDATIRIAGVFSYCITDPLTAYRRLMGNVSTMYSAKAILGQLESELKTHIQSIGASLCAEGVRASSLPGLLSELANGVKASLNRSLEEKRGMQIAELNFSTFSVVDYDMNIIASLQKDKVLTDPEMAGAVLTEAAASALGSAAVNPGTLPLVYWVCSCGMQSQGKFCPECGTPRPTEAVTASAEAPQPSEEELPLGFWRCTCGTITKESFCRECGMQRPNG